ncbi:hypothetical protein EV207_14723 [Scopulibacillus darangshiensis]|uniref:Uncharacterized protein n=1 Tax=Scopulibacillus darangshiensis TaxID=442528 RepID=A0A4R2NIA2_9BACL|nr:hypothetical protein [Scopulibacillus darangshiensis]TCP20972.1 hypothetical protein EV207_14723 [Scopulibacillus darangshiensis]
MSNLTAKTFDDFSKAFDTLENAKSFAKTLHRNEVLQLARRMMQDKKGIEHLYGFADQFEEAGLFTDTPWEQPSKLQPILVAGTLKATGNTALLEVLSELRMLAIAKGRYENSQVTSKDASYFLNEVMAHNINLLFPDTSESSRIEAGPETERANILFQFLADHLSLNAILHSLLSEIDRLALQRPIMVNRITKMILTAKEAVTKTTTKADREKLKKYETAISGPTPISKKVLNSVGYENLIKTAGQNELYREAELFSESMTKTGLVCPYHADFLRYINKAKPELVGTALCLSDKGKANFEEHVALIQKMIDIAVFPATCQSIYGLSLLLNRGVLSSLPVAPGLRRLIDLDIHPEVGKTLESQGVTPNGVMVAGTISVLGQPLGIGQGMNPTCQSARGISLWAQHAPGKLLELIAKAARDREIEMPLEGSAINSKSLAGGLAPDLNKELDPISLILVPHLDRIYDEMMKRMVFRGEDGHKWVNPAIYGRWVSDGFTAVTDPYTSVISDYEGFVRRFYATHHPDYNGGHELIYPNPVGIFITNVHANLLGLHAISIQRIKADPSGVMRVYFYNPNNDGGQNWGQNIICSIFGNGEEEGESSLPFHEFVSRMYAFHYDPFEIGETQAVNDDVIKKIETLARDSWGKNYVWAAQPGANMY